MDHILFITSMSEITEWALNNMTLYGVPILLFLTYVGSLGIPFPVTLVIVAAGAFAREGYFTWWQAALACLAGSSLADNSEYLLGHMAGQWLRQRFEQKPAWQRASAAINQQGGWAIILTRFWLTPLAPAINLITGSRYPYARFLCYDLVGEFLWVLIYGGLGYLFAAQWRLVSQNASQVSSLSVIILLAGLVVFLLFRHFKKHPRSE